MKEGIREKNKIFDIILKIFLTKQRKVCAIKLWAMSHFKTNFKELQISIQSSTTESGGEKITKYHQKLLLFNFK